MIDNAHTHSLLINSMGSYERLVVLSRAPTFDLKYYDQAKEMELE